MTRKFKTLGLAFLAIFALSATAASGAQAGVFKWDSGTNKLLFSQDAIGGEQVLETTAGSIRCDMVKEEAAVSGTGAETVTTASITYWDTIANAETSKNPEEDICRGPLGTHPIIRMNGCSYVFHSGNTVTGGTQGTVDFSCPAGAEFTMEASGLCTLHIGPQTGLGPVNYKNVAGPPSDVTMEWTVTNIHYKHTGLCGTGEASTGKYHGNITVQAFNGNTQTNMSVE